MTYEDTVDIDFAVRHGADFVCANYVAKPADLEEIRRLPGVKESGVGIIAKIESREGIANADDIIAACDGVILPRSDIAVDMPVEQVAHIQKQLIYKANVEGKPVFIANQILNSMIQNPRPTRYGFPCRLYPFVAR
jgi:pyruvate kinase